MARAWQKQLQESYLLEKLPLMVLKASIMLMWEQVICRAKESVRALEEKQTSVSTGHGSSCEQKSCANVKVSIISLIE